MKRMPALGAPGRRRGTKEHEASAPHSPDQRVKTRIFKTHGAGNGTRIAGARSTRTLPIIRVDLPPETGSRQPQQAQPMDRPVPSQIRARWFGGHFRGSKHQPDSGRDEGLPGDTGQATRRKAQAVQAREQGVARGSSGIGRIRAFATITPVERHRRRRPGGTRDRRQPRATGAGRRPPANRLGSGRPATQRRLITDADRQGRCRPVSNGTTGTWTVRTKHQRQAPCWR